MSNSDGEPTPLEGTKWVTRKFGHIDNLKQEPLVLPAPKTDQVRIIVRAIGLNFADVYGVLGLYSLAGQPPFTPGFEVCGVVDAAGSEAVANGFTPGTRVYALTKFNGYATVALTHIDHVHKLPDDWSFADGAAFLAQAFTAWYAICLLGMLPADPTEQPRPVTSEKRTVLIHSAAGGVGLQAIEIVKKLNGTPICTIGDRGKIGALVERGIPEKHIVVRGEDDKAEGFEKTVRKMLDGEGVDIIVDPLMGKYFEPGFNLLNAGGRHIVLGSSSLMPTGPMDFLRGGLKNAISLAWGYLIRPKVDVLGAVNANKSVAAFNIGCLFKEKELMKLGMNELTKLDLPKPQIGRTFVFDEAKQALSYFQTGKSIGKNVLLVPEEDENEEEEKKQEE